MRAPGSPAPSSSSSSSSRRLHQQQQLLHIQQLKVTKKANNEPVRNPLAMIGMLFIGLLLVLFIMAFFAYAPLLCASWLGIMQVVALYLTTESKWWWHDAQEFENRFWTMTAFLFSTAVLYIKDSPLAIGRYNSSLGMVLVTSFTAGVHFLDRRIHRKEISRQSRLQRRHLSHENLFKYRAPAEEKAKLIAECVCRIDRDFLPSTINNMLNLEHVRRQEQKIYRILAGASKDELNFMVSNVKLALLFYKVKDHSRLRSDQSRTLILDLFCVKRLADLTVTSRAILLDALMVMRISAHPMCEKWVRNIILKTTGDDLSNLKSFTDAKGDFHSLHKLVFNDIRDADIRNDILNHIQREARVQIAHMKLGTKRAMKRRLQAWRKVLSDVDDTLYCSGGRYPAGMDTRYPRHAVYPGVLSFYRELDMGMAGSDEWTDDRVGNLVFLSARPHVYKDVTEKKSFMKFASMYEKMGMHTMPTMLAGGLKSGSAFVLQGDLEPMAQKKFENFCEYYKLYPEFRHVFIGDNGQGDVRAAELIAEKYGTDVLEGGFFHLVQPIEKTFGYHSKDDIERWRKLNIVFFNTYVGAAVEAYKKKMIRLSGFRKICEAARQEFVSIDSWSSPDDRNRARLLFNADLENANALFGSEYEPLKLVARPQLFPLNSRVRTPFGQGIVRKYRAVEAIYHVELVDWVVSRSRKRAVGYFTEDAICFLSRQSRTKEVRNQLRYIKFYKAPLARVLPAQTLVNTPFGSGRIVNFRAEDEIYVVAIDGAGTMLNMTGYFAPDAVTPVKGLDASGSSPRMFAGVRSSIGYITKKLSNFVPGSSSSGKALYPLGSTVDTMFGRALVVEFRGEDRVYEVQLLKSGLPDGAIAFLQESSIKTCSVSPSRSFFSIWGMGSATSSYENGDEKNTLVVPAYGTPVITPYGKGIMKRYRAEDEICEVLLTDWSLANQQQVVAYLVKSLVQRVAPEMPPLSLSVKGTTPPPPSSGGLGLFQLFRYGFNSNSQSSNNNEADASNQLLVPYADDSAHRRVETEFGVGFTPMSKAHNGVLKVFLDDPNLSGVVAYVQEDGIKDLPAHRRKNTLELFGNPFNYLRGSWIASGADDPHGLEALAAEAAGPIQLFSYRALVQTPFGEGVVEEFRPIDGVYVVNMGQSAMKAYCHHSSLAFPTRGVVGGAVLTSFGSGTLESIRSDDGIHIVRYRHVVTSRVETRGFLQPSSVLKVLPAARGDVVMTPFGRGLVLRYRSSDGFYCVALQWDLASQLHKVTAYIKSSDIGRLEEDEKASSNCAVM